MKIASDIFNKYTQPWPDYQCYPTTLDFHECLDPKAIMNQLNGLRTGEMSLQLFLPYCRDPDCHSTNYQIKFNENSELKKYIKYIKSETLIYKRYGNRINIKGLHFYGGEFSLLAPSYLGYILEMIKEAFHVDFDEIDMSIEVNPRYISIKKLQKLHNLGFNQLKIPILNYDYKLDVGRNSFQSYRYVEKLMENAREIGFENMSVELLYGVPLESLHSAKRTIKSLIAMKCEHIILNRYFHRPYLFKLQKMLNKELLASDEKIHLIFECCVNILLEAGYRHLGMNNFVCHDSPLYVAREKQLLNYNHMGFTTNKINNVLSLGASVISKVNGFFYQNHIKIEDYYHAINNKSIPAMKFCKLDNDLLLRKKIIKSLIINSGFDIEQGNEKLIDMIKSIKGSGSDFIEMEKDGLLYISNEHIMITELGRYFLKSICALFDAKMTKLISCKTV